MTDYNRELHHDEHHEEIERRRVRPFVLIQVSGGVAGDTVAGPADVVIVDWDNIEAETSSVMLRELLDTAESAAGMIEETAPRTALVLREEVNEARGRIAKLRETGQ